MKLVEFESQINELKLQLRAHLQRIVVKAPKNRQEVQEDSDLAFDWNGDRYTLAAVNMDSCEGSDEHGIHKEIPLDELGVEDLLAIAEAIT